MNAERVGASPSRRTPELADERPEDTGDARLSSEIAEESKRLIADPPGEIRRLEHVAQRGESAATPMIAISGVALVVVAIFAVVVAIALAAYLIAR